MTSDPLPERVAVVGAGPAGLTAALCLARYNRRVLLFDAGQGRSSFHQVNRNYLGFVGGVPAARLRELGRRQLADYPHVTIIDRRIDEVEGADDGFTLTSSGRGWGAEKLIMATGVVDEYPQFEGWRSYVGRSLFWCIACDGYECRGKRVVVVGHTDAAAREAMQMRSLTSNVTLLTNAPASNISSSVRARLDRRRITLLEDCIATVDGVSGHVRAVHTSGGRSVEADAVFSIQGSRPRSDLASSLGADLDEEGYVVVDSEQRTSTPGFYAAGDVACKHSHQVSAAAAEGTQAAAAANYDLLPAEIRA